MSGTSRGTRRSIAGCVRNAASAPRVNASSLLEWNVCNKIGREDPCEDASCAATESSGRGIHIQTIGR